MFPRWLRIFSAVAGVCGILAPFCFTFFAYRLWTLVCGVTLVTRRTPSARRPQESLVRAGRSPQIKSTSG